MSEKKQKPEAGKYELEVGGAVHELTLDELKLCAECVIAKAQDKQEADDGFERFAKSYPDVHDFPPEVAARIQDGESPLEAYRGYELEMLRAKLGAIENNGANAEKAMGSVRGDAGDTDVAEMDAFIESLYKY